MLIGYAGNPKIEFLYTPKMQLFLNLSYQIPSGNTQLDLFVEKIKEKRSTLPYMM